MRKIVASLIGDEARLYSLARRITARIKRPAGVEALDIQHDAIVMILAEAHRFPAKYADDQLEGWLRYLIGLRLRYALKREYDWANRRFPLPDSLTARQELSVPPELLDTFKPHERRIIELRLQNFKTTEIARALGYKSTSAVRMTLNRLRKRLCESS